MWASIVALFASFFEKIGVSIILDLVSKLTGWLMGLWQKREQAQQDTKEAEAYQKTVSDPKSTLEQKNAAEDKLLNS